jgi:excisionase family DNA binding protein
MEKICIVKRRREYAQTDVKLILPDNQNDNLPPEVAANDVVPDTLPEFPESTTALNVTQPDIPIDNLPPEIAISSLNISSLTDYSNTKIVEEFLDKSYSVISITMTREQTELLKQSEYIKELLEGKKKDPSLDITINDNGQLSLNFHYNESMTMRMLSSSQVCQMLQISRSFLQKLINNKKLTSYKIGRLRRFLFEDVLEYLSRDSEFSVLDDKK